MPGVSDPYKLLGVPRGATLRQIKAAHRALAKRYHPDSPTADAQRFLHVQEAYQLLADPLRRREWDARHAPAPVRADDAAPAGARPRRRPGPAAAREQQARAYTWSASEVPWWEDAGRRGQRARAAAADDGPAERTASRPSHSDASTRERRAAADAQPEPPDPEQPRADFDVYNRSSGAAWSAAARAYFRRADQDLPRRGAFHYQGTQPLTGARARAATAARAATPAATSAEAGVARDAERISQVRARVRREQAGRWPSPLRRLLYVSLAWLPLALLIGFGGPVAAGCDGAAVCPPGLGVVQAFGAAALLVLFYTLPKLAYGAALATTLLAVAGLLLLLAAWLLRVPPPQMATIPPVVLVVVAALLLGAYLLIGTWLGADASRRPWATTRLRR